LGIMPKAMFHADRYHMTMGNFSLSPYGEIEPGKKLAEANATFYCAFRKLPFAPCVGHKRLVEYLTHIAIDAPRIRFLKDDRAGLDLIAKHLEMSHTSGVVRVVRPGTIMFPGEPFADITGPFVTTQLAEVKFEHAFDIPMTIASRALEMRCAAGPDRLLSDFSLRRNGEIERSVDVAEYSLIGGFSDTSNMEAAFLLDQFPIGTMAHYLVQSYRGVHEIDSKTGKPKHFQQVCFERWLDAHPNGTTLLLDTISVFLGIRHAIAAAKSSPARKKAFRACRIDMEPLGTWSAYAQMMFDANDMSDVKIITTGDHDKNSIAEVIRKHPQAYGFGVGTKLCAEVEHVAGVVFKECLINGIPTIKCSSREKATLPGALQVWRYQDENGYYLFDVIAGNHHSVEDMKLESFSEELSAHSWEPLLEEFLVDGAMKRHIPSMQEQKEFVRRQIAQFRDPYHYPVILHPDLKKLIEEVSADMRADANEYPGVVMPSMPKFLEE
jgi:nicotinate phosphoribosyltransferase